MWRARKEKDDNQSHEREERKSWGKRRLGTCSPVGLTVGLSPLQFVLRTAEEERSPSIKPARESELPLCRPSHRRCSAQ